MASFASPHRFLKLTEKLVLPLVILAGLALAAGLYLALMASPADYQQGEAVRIMYVHVPAAWMALGSYLLLGILSIVFLSLRHGLADVMARECAVLGAGFTFICLATGAIWGKPMWGAWWVWDARLTSVLVLFFLFVGYLALDAAVEAGERGRKLCAWLAVIGLVNLPVIRFSVEWWNTLHQPASVLRAGGVAIDGSMLAPLLVMALGFALAFAAMLLARTRKSLRARRSSVKQRA